MLHLQVFAGLYEWREGTKKKVNFDGNIFVRIYREHVTTLEDVKNDSPVAYHAIMHKLYNEVM